MSATGLEVFDRTIHETNAFVKVMMRELETDDRRLAFGALRGALHALRDHLDLAATAQFSAQLPMLLRGLYYEGWVPQDASGHARKRGEFLDHVAKHLPPQLQRYPEEAARAAFAALSERLDEGELAKLVAHMPRALKGLWPARPEASN